MPKKKVKNLGAITRKFGTVGRYGKLKQSEKQPGAKYHIHMYYDSFTRKNYARRTKK